MDKKEMKKILAGVGIAGLLSGVPMGGGVAFGGSGWGSKGDSAVGTEKHDGMGAGSGWGGHKEGAVGTQEETTKKPAGEAQGDEKAPLTPEEEEKMKTPPAGSSSWSGHK